MQKVECAHTGLRPLACAGKTAPKSMLVSESRAQLPPRNRAPPQLSHGITSIAVFHMPWTITIDELMNFWPMDGTYNYLNVLYNHRSGHNVGYCFLNFTRPEFAQEFVERWHGRYLTGWAGRASLLVKPSRVQGLQAHLERLRTERLDLMAAVGVPPVVVLGGRRVDPIVAMEMFGIGWTGPLPGCGQSLRWPDQADQCQGHESALAECSPHPKDVPWPRLAGPTPRTAGAVRGTVPRTPRTPLSAPRQMAAQLLCTGRFQLNLNE
mmetsp:Transcript_75069/g.174083  ORF Transcript_75069/g.174083 Transcript_75069/m.174083 type:complete len:266 (+) Transcript_75069:30-827(+)